MSTNNRRRILNEKYPCRTLNKQAPLKAFPQAAHSKRHYTIELEEELLKVSRIEQYLTKCTWHRKVSSVKTLSLKKIYYLKDAKPGTYVHIKFCTISKKLIFRDDNELILGEILVRDFAKKLLNQPTSQELSTIKKQLFENEDFPLK